jgi:hypothetical protein
MVKRYTISYELIKWLAAGTLTLFVIFSVASWYYSEKLRPIITHEIKDLVLSTTDSLYQINFSTVKTNVFTGNASLSDVEIIPDSSVLRRLGIRHKAPNNVYTIRVKKLSIRGFHPWRLFKHQKLNVEQLLLDNPSIQMANRQQPYNENKRAASRSSPYAYISKYLKEFRVNTIRFSNIRFKYVNNNLSRPETDSLVNLNVTLKDWLIDAKSASDPTRMYLLKDIVLNIKDYAYATPDSLYHIRVDRFDFRASTGRIKINQFRLVPRYSEMEFGQVAGYAKDRFNISLNDISLSGIDFPLYVRKQELLASEMNINNGFLAVFNNNMLPEQNLAKVGKFPHQLLQSVKAAITVKKLSLDRINISYAEYDRDSKEKGIITFDNTSGLITNVTNAPAFKKRDPFMFARMHSKLMGEGKMDVNFRFDLSAADGGFAYAGVLKNMDGRALNKVTRPLGMLQIRSGYINQLSFRVQANDKRATGKLNFRYERLGVNLLEREEGEDHLVKKGWLSFLANNLVLNTSNPDRNGKFVTANINYAKVPTSTFFSYLYKTLFEGIRYSIGFTDSKEQQIKEQVEKFEKMKADRELRRENRRKRQLQQKRPRDSRP